MYPPAWELEKKRRVTARKLRKADTEEDENILTAKIQKLSKQMLTMPHSDPFDDSYKRLQYVRYADDFLIGVIGSKEDTQAIKAQVDAFVSSTLKLELSDEKTLVTHSAKRARFLGYDIYVHRSNVVRRDKHGIPGRYLYGKVCLELPTEIMRQKLLEYGVMTIEKIGIRQRLLESKGPVLPEKQR